MVTLGCANPRLTGRRRRPMCHPTAANVDDAARRLGAHVCRDPGRRRRDPPPPAEPSRAPEALPAAARRAVAAPGVRSTAPVRADRRHHGRHRPPLPRHSSASRLPGVDVVLEPLGRNTAAAIALAALAIDRPEDEVMVVLPADQTVEDADVFRGVLAAAAERPCDRGIRHRRSARHPRHPGRPAGDRVRLPHPGPRARRGHRRPPGLSAAAVRGETRSRRAPSSSLEQPGVAWNAGIFLWRRRAILAALGRYTGLLQSLGPMAGSPAMPRARVRTPSSSRSRSTTR